MRAAGVEVLATYPDVMLLVRATDAQVDELDRSEVEATALPDQRVQVGGSSFAFDDAVDVRNAAAIKPLPGRIGSIQAGRLRRIGDGR